MIAWCDSPPEVESLKSVMQVTITSGKERHAFAMSAGNLLALIEAGRRALVSRRDCSAEIVSLVVPRRRRRTKPDEVTS